MKIAVINIKELFKYLVAIVVVCVILAITTNFFSLKRYIFNNEKEEKSSIKKYVLSKIDDAVNFINNNNVNKRTIMYMIPDIKLENNNENSYDNNKNEKNVFNNIEKKIKISNITSKILSMQLSSLNTKDLKESIEKKSNNENYNSVTSNKKQIVENTVNNFNKNVNQNIDIKINDVENEKHDLNNKNINEKINNPDEKNISVVEENNLPAVYNVDIDGIQIKNQSSYEVKKEMINTNNFKFDNPNNILIFHTHTCESYTMTENRQYEESGTYRTLDKNNSVAGVGNKLQEELLKYGYNIIHDTTYHDYPKYNGSYSRSLITVSNILKDNPNMNFIIDLHRDAIGSTPNYAPKVKIGDEYASQLMFVLGSDGGGLEHSNWQSNLKYAVSIQKKANELYPGLFRPIILRNSRYNQHLAKGAVIIEVGATGNTIQESENSMKYLAKVISEVVK